jgi:adenylylsulfate kinase
MVQKIYWFTGQPGAGKTTLAKGLMNRLSLVNFIHVDGDDIRDIFQNKDYSENGRRQNIQRAQDIAQFLNAKGNNVIVSLVSPYKDQRDNFKQNPNVVEIYVHTDEIRGREQFHVQNYEPPTENFIEINTTNTTVDECVEKIIKYVG